MTRIATIFIALFFFSCYFPDKGNDSPYKITRSTSISQPNFNLKYPADWTIDSSDKDYDLNSLFTLRPPSGDGYSLFILYNTPIDEEVHISNQVKDRLNKAMKNGMVSYF